MARCAGVGRVASQEGNTLADGVEGWGTGRGVEEGGALGRGVAALFVFGEEEERSLEACRHTHTQTHTIRYRRFNRVSNQYKQ